MDIINSPYLSHPVESVESRFRQLLKVLIDHHQLNIKELPQNDQLYQIYQDFVAIVEQYPQTDHLKEIILQQYIPSQLEIGSIGSEIFGCLQQHYGKVSKECSLICHNNIFSDSSCSEQIWQQTAANGDLRLMKINKDNNSSQGIIYVLDNFLYFTNTEYNLLANSGLTYVQIFKTRYGKHLPIGTTMTIEDLPQKHNYQNNLITNITISKQIKSLQNADPLGQVKTVAESSDFNSPEKHQSMTDATHNITIVIILLIIVVMAIIFIYLM